MYSLRRSRGRRTGLWQLGMWRGVFRRYCCFSLSRSRILDVCVVAIVLRVSLIEQSETNIRLRKQRILDETTPWTNSRHHKKNLDTRNGAFFAFTPALTSKCNSKLLVKCKELNVKLESGLLRMIFRRGYFSQKPN